MIILLGEIFRSGIFFPNNGFLVTFWFNFADQALFDKLTKKFTSEIWFIGRALLVYNLGCVDTNIAPDFFMFNGGPCFIGDTLTVLQVSLSFFEISMCFVGLGLISGETSVLIDK